MEIDTYFLHAITTDSGMDLEYKTVFHVRVALEKKKIYPVPTCSNMARAAAPTPRGTWAPPWTH